MEQNSNIICIGESLIDFICEDVNQTIVTGNHFIKKAGGAPANVCAAITKLGGNASFCGKVGNDPFGLFLKHTMDLLNIDTSMMILDDTVATTLAFVSLTESGERDFVFNRGADEKLMLQDLDLEKIESAKIMHFGSATALLGGRLGETYLTLMKDLSRKGTFISFDPNYREDLWKHKKDAFINQSQECLSYCDFVKVSDEELKLIAKKDELTSAVQEFHRLGAKIVAVTLGKEGTLISNGTNMETIKSIAIKSIDSTGAGDAFVGSYLYQVATANSPKQLATNFEQLKEFTTFSNRVGAIVCTKLGAIDGLPTLEEVKNYNKGV